MSFGDQASGPLAGVAEVFGAFSTQGDVWSGTILPLSASRGVEVCVLYDLDGDVFVPLSGVTVVIDEALSDDNDFALMAGSPAFRVARFCVFSGWRATVASTILAISVVSTDRAHN